MKIDKMIGTGAPLLGTTHAVLPARWGAGVSGVEFSNERSRRARVYGASLGTTTGGSCAFQAPDLTPAGVPLPIGERSP